MIIVAARRYRGGETTVADIPVDGLGAGPAALGEFNWTGVAAPDQTEMELLRRQYGLHPLAVEDALNPTPMPKVESYDDVLFIVARTAALTGNGTISYGQTTLFLSKNFVVSVRIGSERANVDLRRRLELGADKLAEGPDYLAHAILDFIVDGYRPIIDSFKDDVQHIEEQAIDLFLDTATIRRIFRLRHQLRCFERICGPMEAVGERLSVTDFPMIDNDAKAWFRDVLDHVRRAMAWVRGLRETLDTVVEPASLLEQHRQGKITRWFAAWAAILALPTAIAGIYGMNFDVMPELRWRYGYFIVLGVIAAICGALWLNFRKIDWL
ncbi:MAG: magnesium and cobalt transport protein CorA [Alphaproteobacteria bacterium]|nr:magnesium and cobalt transport protein CorA [Alphaproteobacteria bacterium]